MKKLHINLFWRYLITSIAVNICLLLSSTVSLGDLPKSALLASSQQITDCRLSPNPDDCYRKQTQQKWAPYDPRSALPPLNTQVLGLDSPVSAEFKYDADLSWVIGLQYLHMFSDNFGISTKLTGGPNEYRGNLTTGYAFSKDHQIKLTYEYLTQNLPFNFASGSTDEWVEQHSLGAAYQYVIRGAIVHSLELSGYVTRAKSKELENLAFNQQVIIPGSEYSYDVNFRRIAGGSENTVLASVNLFPFATDKTTLTLGGGYSNISYDTRYESNQAASRPAFKVEFTHLLSPKAKITASTIGTAASVEHTLGFSYLLPRQFESTLKGQYTTGQATLPNNKSVTVGLAYPAPANYSSASFGDAEALKSWIDKPVVYSTRVLAIKDEMVKRFEFKKCSALPDQSKFWDGFLDPVPTNLAFCFTDADLQVTYTVTTVKISSSSSKKEQNVSTKAPSDTTDYTQNLNLALVSNGLNQAILKSTAAIPEFLDSEHTQTSRGSYQVTMTATAISHGMAPITMSNGFVLIVGGDQPPTWDNSTISDAYMGFVYPKPPESEIDLTNKVTLHTPDTAVDIAIDQNAPDCPSPPSWLGIVACTGNPSHLCLTSGITPVANDVNDPGFCVRLIATGLSSETSSSKAFPAKIIQTPPHWVFPATPSLPFNTIPSAPIDLNTYITPDTSLALSFKEGPNFDAVHWSLDANGQLRLIAQAPAGAYSIPINANNDTSFFGETRSVPVNVVNTNLDVNWVNNKIEDGFAGRTYDLYLNKLSEADALVKTTDAGTPFSDLYDFNIIGTPSQGTWDVQDEADIKDRLIGNGLLVGPVAIQFTAHSHAAQKDATPTVYTVTLDVLKNPRLKVEWTDVKTLPDVRAGVPFTPLDLQAFMGEPSNRKLIETQDERSLPIAQDTYAFSLLPPPASTPGWSIDDTDKKTLKGPAVPVTGEVKLVLAAESFQSGTNASGGSGGGSTYEQALTFKVDPNPTDLSVNWTDVKTLEDTPAGEPYEVDLNSLNETSAALVKTIHGTEAIEDTYTFELVSSTDPAWTMDGNRLKNPFPKADTTATLTFKATSTQAFPKQATGGTGTSDPIQQVVTIHVSQNHSLLPKWTAVSTLPTRKAGQNYSIDLNALRDAGVPLVETKNSLGQVVPGDVYTFALVDRPDSSWTVSSDGKFLQNASPKPGTIQVTLTAKSKEAGEYATGDTGDVERVFNITIEPNPDLTVAWTGVSSLQKIGKAGEEYKIEDLNTLSGAEALVQTKDTGTPVPKDIYTFTKVSGDSNFRIENGKTLIADAPTAGTFNIVLTAISSNTEGVAPGVSAKEGNVSDLEQSISITIEANPTLSATWVTVPFPGPILPKPGKAQEAYSQHLNALNDTANELITTKTTDDRRVSDHYTFTINTIATDPGWEIIGDDELVNTAPVFLGRPAQVRLMATSRAAGGAPVTGGNALMEAVTSVQQINLTINQNPSLDVKWTGKDTVPTEGTFRQAYSQDLSVLQPDTGTALVKTALEDQTTSVSDTYHFDLISSPDDDPGWSIDNTDPAHQKLVNSHPSKVGQVKIVLEATSTQAGKQADGGSETNPQQQAILITVKPDETLVPEWINPGPALPDPVAQQGYTQNLNNLALVSTPTDSTDKYDFSFDQTPAQGTWTLTDDGTGRISQLTAVSLPPAGTTVDFLLTAKSHHAGKDAINGNDSSTVQKLSITVQPNSALEVLWTNKSPPSPAYDATFQHAYSQDLSLLQPGADALVTTTGVPSDVYKFTIASGSDPGWRIDSVTEFGPQLLRHDSPSTVGDATIILVATSRESGTEAREGTGGGGTTEQAIKIKVNPDSSLEPKWTSVTELPNATVRTDYSEDMNALSVPSVVLAQTFKPGGVIPIDPKDEYDFEIIGVPSRGEWTLTDNGHGRISQLKGVGPTLTAGPPITIQLRAKSRDSDKFADNGNVPPLPSQIRELIIPIHEPPKFTNNPTGTIKFETTGDFSSGDSRFGPELGLITDGIHLNPLVSNASDFSNLTFEFGTDPVSSANWQIKQDPHDPTQYYLLRRLVIIGTPPAVPNRVSAEGVNDTVPIPSINACTTDFGLPKVCGSSAQAGSTDPAPIKVDVRPDKGVVYLYGDDPTPPPIVLNAMTSNGFGAPGQLTQPSFFGPLSGLRRFTSDTLFTEIGNVGRATFAIPAAPNPPPSYIQYVSPSVGGLILLTPDAPGYTALAGSPNSSYLNALSPENGFDGTINGNLRNLPPITAGYLILVPSRGTINNGFNTNNMGPNVGVGINSLGASCTATNLHDTVSVLRFHLDPPPSGKQYYLTQLNTTPASSVTGVCIGANNPAELLPERANYPGASGCGGTAAVNAGTWSAEKILPVGQRCSGIAGSVPATGSLPLLLPYTTNPNDGNFALFASALNMNRGLLFSGYNPGGGSGISPDFPLSYNDSSGFMNQRLRNQTAIIFGQGYFNDYLDFPRVVLQ